MFTRSIGRAPSAPLACAHGCPDILEMGNGDFAVIGSDITEEAASQLPEGSKVAPGERLVRIPRNLLIRALAEIPRS